MSAQASFDLIVAEHEQEVLRICCSVLHDEHLGRDAMQDTFVKLWRSGAAALAPEGRGAWLRRVALTSSIDLARRVARNGRLQEGARREVRQPTGRASDARAAAPIAALLEAELRGRLRTAVAQLPERQREIFTLRHERGLPLREVARQLGIEITTVKTQFTRACWKLQAKLAPLLDGDDEEPRL